jgi:hypothetical protein
MDWRDLKTDPPTGDRAVLLFPCISDVGHLYTVSNTQYARARGTEFGYTHWSDIPVHPKELEIEAKCRELGGEERKYKEEWYKGFHRAATVISDFLDESNPDLAQKVRERYYMFEGDG